MVIESEPGKVVTHWLSRDPLPDAERSQGPNLYEYVGNDPVNLTDPLGLAGAGGEGPKRPGTGSTPCPCGTHYGVYWSQDAANKMLDFYSGGFWGAGATAVGGQAIASGGSAATAAGYTTAGAALGTAVSILSWYAVAAFGNALLDGLQEGCVPN